MKYGKPLQNKTLIFKYVTPNVLRLLSGCTISCQMFKTLLRLFHHLDYITFASGDTRSTTAQKLKAKYSHTSRSQPQYFNRILSLWNTLTPTDISASLYTIKKTKQFILNSVAPSFTNLNLTIFTLSLHYVNVLNVVSSTFNFSLSFSFFLYLFGSSSF